MGLRCLIGHNFGPPETTREREREGNEVVVTVREFKECQRCGERRVISENKEVRADERSTAAEEPEPEPSTDDDRVEATAEYQDVSAEEDDGVILEDEPASVPDRERGQWPSDPREGDEGELGEAAWPTVEGEDEGFSAEAGNDEAVDDVEFQGSLTPQRNQANEQPPDDGEVLSAGGGNPRRSEAASVEIGPERTGPTPEQTGDSAPASATEEPAVLRCPACEHETPGLGGSHRPGDICPSCGKGYLAER